MRASRPVISPTWRISSRFHVCPCLLYTSRDNAVGGVVIAYLTILVLGASFSLVPASLWPSVPKLVDAKIIGCLLYTSRCV